MKPSLLRNCAASLGLVLFVVAGCSPGVRGTASVTAPTADHVVISELLAGAAGDNNHEFIELYNPTEQAVDLNGWRLAYRLPSSTSDLPVYAWDRSTMIPGHGYFLLVRQGQDVGIAPDAIFDQPLNTTSGGLALYGADSKTDDAIGWGDGPPGMTEGVPAPALTNGQSLERAPGGDLGNGADTGDNAADFSLNASPNPQDTGSPAHPSLSQSLTFTVTAPSEVDPGGQIDVQLALTNTGDADLSSVAAKAWLPTSFRAGDLPEGAHVEGGQLTWDAGALSSGASRSLTLQLTAPWTRGEFALLNPMAASPDSAAPVFAFPAWITVVDGPIPIAVARNQLNQAVTVEGAATITTGALFAGSGNTKFYMSDPTGGVQVWVPGGEFDLAVPLGSKVRVHGTPQDYRGTVELVADSPDSIEIISQEETPEPQVATISQTQQTPDELAGRLIRVDGQLTQAIEETYSYNLELTNAQGEALDVYVDKQTQLQIEGLAIDQPYSITGILETPDGVPTLYPRIESDFERSYPKALLFDLSFPANVLPGNAFEVSATLNNYTGQAIDDLTVTTQVPAMSHVVAIGAGGQQSGNSITWKIDTLAGSGSQTLTYQARSSLASGAVGIPIFQANSTTAVAASQGGRVFVGSIVPIWAIQGEGQRSPYVLQSLTTEGVVTGVFPGLSGFWIQSTQPDGDPKTSDGVFVNAGVLRIQVASGDLVDVTGRVRELSEQTQLELTSVSDVQLIRHGARLPSPTALDPPPGDEAALDYLEAREGMLVTVQEPAVAVGPTSIYGEYTLVLARYGVDRILRGQPAGRRIVVDDGANTVHNTNEGLAYEVAVGDTVGGLVGPLAYTFGQHKIEPLTAPKVTKATHALPSLPPTPEGEFRLMTWNAENLFDTLPPYPSDPPPPTIAEYQRDLQKVAATIQAAGAPTVVALQEVENIEVLNDLASLDNLAPYHYAAYLMEGTDSRGIDVGYLVRTDRGEVTQVRQLPVPEGLLSRPPLEIAVRLKDVEGLTAVTLFNNHFTALSGGIDITRPRRIAQANLDAQAAKQLLSQSPSAPIAVLGDLNSFYDSPPLETLIQAGLTDLFDHLAPDQRYSYIYQGVAQTLDHILVSQGLGACLTDFTVLHLDSPYPPPAPDDASAIRKSDHDPLVASFRCAR